MQPGLYERIVTLALEQDLESLADPRLYATAPIEVNMMSCVFLRPQLVRRSDRECRLIESLARLADT